MQNLATLIVKIILKIIVYVISQFNFVITLFILYTNNIRFQKISTVGIPFVSVARGGNCVIGNNFRMNNNIRGNPIGRNQKCMLVVDKGASLKIGDNVGISAASIVAHKNITIGNYVTIGGGVCIYDTDFHSLDPQTRRNPKKDREEKQNKPVIIDDNVFIGAHSTVLKGVKIGNNSIIGACSVVTKNIPPNEIWAGNPASCIKKLENDA